jgi:hypothetical protein
MSEPKPLASLSGNLLARKGAARPAMRPQVQRLAAEEAPPEEDHLEDLGWDDMGESANGSRHADILPLTPAPLLPEALAEARADDEAAAAQLARNARQIADAVTPDIRLDAPVEPEVVRQQASLARKLATAKTANGNAAIPVADAVAPAAKPAAARPVAPKPTARPARSRRPAQDEGRRAAFTLRLDEDRHLKLRLASTIMGRSAQQLVTRALDQLLKDMPEIQMLAAQVRRRGPDSAN